MTTKSKQKLKRVNNTTFTKGQQDETYAIATFQDTTICEFSLKIQEIKNVQKK